MSGTIDLTSHFLGSGLGLNIRGSIAGLKNGKHGLAIYDGKETGIDCAKAGTHFNPDGGDHGGPWGYEGIDIDNRGLTT